MADPKTKAAETVGAKIGDVGMAAGEMSTHVARMLTTPIMSTRAGLRRLKSLARDITDAVQTAIELELAERTREQDTEDRRTEPGRGAFQ